MSRDFEDKPRLQAGTFPVRVSIDIVQWKRETKGILSLIWQDSSLPNLRVFEEMGKALSYLWMPIGEILADKNELSKHVGLEKRIADISMVA